MKFHQPKSSPVIPEVERSQILEAIESFDQELQETPGWANWEENQAYRYALVHNGNRYPIKQIIHMATGAPKSTFSGGQESNSYLESRHFEVAPLRSESAPGLRLSLEAILARYLEISQSQPFGQHAELWSYFDAVKEILEATPVLRENLNLKVSWSAGRGNWARVPWIVLLDERETRSTQRGVYCVLLFRADMSGLYVTFNQGVTEPTRRIGQTAGLAELRENAERLRDLTAPLTDFGFARDGKIDLHVEAGLGRSYESSTIAYKLYEHGSIPDDEEIVEDIEALLSIYEKYLEQRMDQQVNQAGLKAMRDRFLAYLPEFKDFPSEDPEGAYSCEERNYKVELVERFKQTLREKLSAPAGADANETLLCDGILQFLRKPLKSTGRPQNILSWRAIDFLNHLGSAGKRQFVAALRQLLFGEDAVGVRIESFNRTMTRLLEKTPSRNSPAWSRLFPTFFLMLANPKTEIAIKTTEFEKTAKEVLGAPAFERRFFDEEQYNKTKHLVDIIRDALQKWGWSPRDMLDVQSFIWIAQSSAAAKVEDETEPDDDEVEDEREEVIAYVPSSFHEIREHVLEREGMRLPERQLRQYHTAIESRGFVILSGISGSGKTWLTEAYANAVGARYLLVSVAPNWTTNEDLLGFFNPLDGIYHDTAFSRFLKEASTAHNRAQEAGVAARPYHLVLDEMNLARVEYYFAMFLSTMELRSRHGTAPIALGPNTTIALTPNLKFVGTVNVDETTHGFADKVYDRAQLIELSAPRDLLVQHLGALPFAEVLIETWDAVSEIAPFGFRILDDVSAYIKSAQGIGVGWEEALDEQVLQKILPKIKGADPRVGIALQRIVTLSQDRFPLTNQKAITMLDRFQQHGFTSYF